MQKDTIVVEYEAMKIDEIEIMNSEKNVSVNNYEYLRLQLRNRVCHYERICHYPDIKEKHERLLECTEWISPAVAKIAKKKL